MKGQLHLQLKTLLDKKITIGLLLIFITIIWGFSWTLMKSSLDYMGPFTFSAFRFGIGSITMLVILWCLKIGLPSKKHMKHIVVGVLQTTVVFLFVMYGLKFVESGKSSVLLYSMPIWSTLLASIFLKEKLLIPKIIGLFLGLLGLLTILGWDVWAKQNIEVILGEILIIISAISWGTSNVYYRKKLNDVSKLQVNTYQMLFGTIGIIFAALFMEYDQPIIFTVESMFIITFTGILASALCFSVWFIVLSRIDMATATISTLLVPVFGLFFGWFILGEPITISILLGSGLIIIGIIVTHAFHHKNENLPSS